MDMVIAAVAHPVADVLKNPGARIMVPYCIDYSEKRSED